MLVGLCGLSAGQPGPPTVIVSPQLQVNPAGEDWTECSIGVGQTNPLEAFAVAMTKDAQGNKKIGSTSIFVLPGGTILGHGYLPCGGADPVARGEPGTGRIWATALIQSGFGEPAGPCGDRGVALGWKEPGYGTIPTGQMYAIPGFDSGPSWDRPTIGIGPDSQGGPDPRHAVLAFNPLCGNPVTHAATSVAPLDSSPTSWDTLAVQPTEGDLTLCDWSGPGPSAVVLDSGRIVSVHADKRGGTNQYNGGRPFILYSEDGGQTWNPNNIENAIKIDPLPASYPTTIDIDDTGGCNTAPAGDSPSMIDDRKCGPTIAVDRGPDPDHVYVAWYAKSAQNATNTDIWIARSLDGGVSWDSAFQQMRVSDQMLGLTDPADLDPITGVDQAMPAIAIDTCGGINLMFYDNRADPDRVNDQEDWLDVYYVRITGFGPSAVVQHMERLTPESFPAQICDDPSAPPIGFLGHYHNMEASADGHNIWLAYIAREGGPESTWSGKNCYVHRVKICTPIPTDFNGDGVTSEPDAVAYTNAWAAQEPEADLDLNWIVDTSDFVTFVDWYTQEIGQ